MSLVITIGIAIFSYSLLSISQAGQKLGLKIKKSKPIKGWCFWSIATFSSIIAVTAILYALSLGNVSIVGAMAGTGLVALTIFSAFVLKEDITVLDITGIIIIILGSIFIGLFSKENYNNKLFNPCLLYILTTLFITICAAGWIIGKKTRWSGLITGSGSGIVAGISMLYQKALIDKIDIDVFIPALFNNIKKAIILIIPGGIYLIFWLLLTTVSFIALQFAYKYGKSIHIIPAYNVSLIIMPVAGGVLIFSEVISILQIIGIGIILTGTIFLSFSRSKKL